MTRLAALAVALFATAALPMTPEREAVTAAARDQDERRRRLQSELAALAA